jgi:hypothetical protein
MNTRLLFFLPLLLMTALATAQLEFGLKAGLTTESLQNETYRLGQPEGRQDLLLALEGADYGFQFGALLRFPLKGSWGLQTEATLNSAKTTFRLDGADGTDNGGSTIFEERYNDVNVPVLLTYQIFKIVRLHAGPVGHFYVSSTSDLTDEEGLDRTFETFNLGYNLGGSIDIGRLTLDVRYGGNFSNYGETFTLRGSEVDVDQAPRRWIGTVAYRF